MAWQGTPSTPPTGYVLAVARRGDDLALYEREEAARRSIEPTRANLNRIGLEIAAANGVPSSKVKTCAWARDVAAWVLGTGGVRNAPVSKSPNTCEPGQGFAALVEGQRILLPIGLRPAAGVPPVASVSVAPSRAPLFAAGALGAFVLGRALFGRRRRKGSA